MTSSTPGGTNAMLRLRALHKSYGSGTSRLHVLKGIDLSIAPGELVSIMGASGSGKSTLLNILGLLDWHDDGEYYLDGQMMHHLSESKAAAIRSRLLGFVFQSFNLIGFKTAAENVAMPLYYQGVPRKERNRRAGEYLDLVGLEPWAKHLPSELSGGQQQRVAIARALISQPKVILADEPTGALDSQTSLEVIELLRRIHRSGVTILIVTHEHDISRLTDRVIRLKDGQIESDGAWADSESHRSAFEQAIRDRSSIPGGARADAGFPRPEVQA